MKIKKKGKNKGQKKKAPQKSGTAGLTDRMNFYIVVGVIILVNILIYFAAFPVLDSIVASGPEAGSEEGSLFLKITLIVLTDIVIFVTLSMILARRSKNYKKR